MNRLFHRRFKFLWNYKITGVETFTTRELHFRWKFWVILEEAAATSCQAKEQILRSKISFLPKNIWESSLILLLFLRNNVTIFILSIFSTEMRTHLEYPKVKEYSADMVIKQFCDQNGSSQRNCIMWRVKV